MSGKDSNIEREWTEPQRRAIEHVGGDLVVSAAAGSGKTAVLAERCARLVCEGVSGGCGVDELLVLTFTEAAANEMRSRIAEAIREKLRGAEEAGRLTAERRGWLERQAAMVERASISTLHSFCARVLRQHFHEAQIDPAFELVDEDEARLMREEAIEEVLARWHGLPVEEGKGAAFAEFFEAYAQGRDGNCREMMLRVYGMLATTADPASYVAGSRGNFVGAGCQEMFGRYVREVMGGKVRLLGIAARRAERDAARHAGVDAVMTVVLGKVAGLLEWAVVQLQEEGAAAISGIRSALEGVWPKQLATMKDVADFEKLKKRAWIKIKDDVKALCEITLSATAEEMERGMAGLAGPLGVLLELVGDFEATYAGAKRGLNRLDFADLERLTLELLTREGSATARELRERYCHLLVDEFQDVNPLQEALLHAVRSGERFEGAGNLFVVGDVKQSIYGFRLADPELFSGRIEAALAGGGRGHVGLPHNFRSQAKLIGAMNGVFEKLLTVEVAGVDYRAGHALEASPVAKGVVDAAEALNVFDGAPVEVHLVAMPEEEGEGEGENEGGVEKENLSAVEREARFVAGRIVRLMAEGRGVVGKEGVVRKVGYRDVAILLRGMKDKAMIFARALAQRGVPVHADLSTGYFDAAEVRDALALLQVLDNGQQDIPMATVLLGPYGRFSHDDLARVRLTFDRKRVSFASAVHRYVLAEGEQVDLARDRPARDEGLVERLAGFLKKMAGWRELLRTRTLHEGLARIYSDAGIMAYLAGLEAGEQRVANLGALHQRALKFAGFSKQGLHRFLRFIEKLREQEGDFGEASVLSEASDVVRIMSVHRSKGLEFPVVVVAGLGGMLNLRSSGPVFVHRRLGIGMHVADVERNVFYPSAGSACILNDNERRMRAEELRLLYVAMTRARDHLILTGHVKGKEWVESKRAEWRGNGDGALPEDVLVRGRTFLEWVVPALASSGMRVRWPGEGEVEEVQVEVSLQEGVGGALEEEGVREAGDEEVVRRILAGERLGEEGGGEELAGVIGRVMGRYAHEGAAERAAVYTVSELRGLDGDGEEVVGRELVRTALGTGALGAGAEESRLRGLATHRVLELLDFGKCGSLEEIRKQVEGMVRQTVLSAEEAGRADVEGIGWVFTTAVGKRVVRAAGEEGVRVRREIGFAWSGPVAGAEAAGDPADWPTVRGTIDLLVANTGEKRAEIVDYKTDSAFTWEGNLAEYEKQMGYYLRAASEILGYRVERATLLFLGVRREVEVVNSENSAY